MEEMNDIRHTAGKEERSCKRKETPWQQSRALDTPIDDNAA